jgi:cytochrome c peroxidase
MLLEILLSIVIPLGLDHYLPVPESNPLTVEKVDLGRRLFLDRRLSRDGSIACATCHDPARAFSDDRARAVGIDGRVGRRNAPALLNRGYGTAFFWDGRTTSLEEQVLLPIEAPDEMGFDRESAAARVGLTVDQLSNALASYVRVILAGNSRLDRFSNGESDALSPQEQRGLTLFRGKARCARCHIGSNLTDERMHNTGVAWKAGDASGEGSFSDDGRFEVTGRETDRGAFKTPTLREVARTAPYMHDGSLATLGEVVDFYDAGGRANPNLDQALRPLGLGVDEKNALLAFLRSLDGEVIDGRPVPGNANR